MKFFTRLLIIVCVITASLVVLPAASADDTNHKTFVTFSAPFEVPGVGAQVLPAGTYVFKIMDSLTDRHIVQIFDKKQTHLFTTILAVPNFRSRTTEKTVITFKERAQGEPEAIRTWFYPGRQWGEEFVYPKAKALELAKVSNEPVFATPVEIASVEEMKTAPIEAVKPTGESVPVAEVIQTPPVEVAKLDAPKMPKTGSNMPLIACFGLLSLGAAGVMKKYSA
ncbi:MAG: hypothetical protein JWO13_3086 [Acidobacteriales bacterium]|nr:hypothetical protein [Terriglobales bacterium]